VLAPHVRLGRRREEGGGKGEARLTGQGTPFAPATYIYGVLMGFILIGPLVILIPLGRTWSWVFLTENPGRYKGNQKTDRNP
jgi:hypothetical protein